jgi:KDO2-lipid IV(A) lauroyltransferase
MIEYAAFQSACTIVRLFPFHTVQSWGASLGEFVFKGLGYRRKVTLDNLRKAFPDATDPEVHDIARESFRNIGSALFEFLWFPRLTAEGIRRLVDTKNLEVVLRARERKKPIIFLTAHFGNWELCAQALTVCAAMPMLIIVKTQSNRWTDAKINRWRTMFGSTTVPMAQAVREVLKTLQQGGVVGIAGDQSAAKESVHVNFFGRRVPTHQGPAAFALKTGAVLAAGFARRLPDGRFLASFEEIPSDDLDPEDQRSIHILTQRHVAVTERAIRAHPGQWMWMHRRWKHADDGTQGGDQ